MKIMDISNKFQHKTLVFIGLSLFIMTLSTSIGRCATVDQGKIDGKSNISFSPDGKTLLFNRYKGYKGSDQSYMIQAYNMNTGELIAYKSLNGEKWDYPQYSFDGKSIVFVTVPIKIIHEKSFFHSERIFWVDSPVNSQIAIMDKDGKNVRRITNTTGIKIQPSFSHSGGKVIFARAAEKEGHHGRGWNWSVNEVDLKTGREICLTQFKFIIMSRPYYFPDDKTFIFWGEYLTVLPGMSDDYRNYSLDDDRKVDKIRNDLLSKYQYNSIYVMQGNEKELKPYIVMPDYQKKFKMYVAGSEYSRDPSLSADGSVLIFMAQGYKPDGSADFKHLYQYSADGNHRSITRIPSTETREAVSPDGKLIAFIPSGSYNIVIYQVKDGTSREITLPDQPSRIINPN